MVLQQYGKLVLQQSGGEYLQGCTFGSIPMARVPNNETKGTYGYVMKLRPKDYYEFGQYLLARAKFKSFEAMVNAAMKICEGFKALHLSGLSYQDLMMEIFHTS